MSVNPDEDTEFNDALRKHGILPAREPAPRTPSPPPSPTLEELLPELTLSELKEIGEDTRDEEMQRIVDGYRRQRIEEDRKKDRLARFGRVYPISREDYTREVTEASSVNEVDDDSENGTGVVCFLYKDGIPHSDRAYEHVRTLAQRYPRTKFVSIVGDKCIPNLPDSRVPMFILYRKGEIRNQLIAWGAERERRLEELELGFFLAGVLHVSERRAMEGSRDDKHSEDEEDDDPSSRMRSAATSSNTRAPKNIRRSSQKDDDDSDFEFDL